MAGRRSFSVQPKKIIEKYKKQKTFMSSDDGIGLRWSPLKGH